MKTNRILFGLVSFLLTAVSALAQPLTQKNDLGAFERYKAQFSKISSIVGTRAVDIEQAQITDAHIDDRTGISFVYFQQVYKGIKVFNYVLPVAFRNNDFLYASGKFVPAIETKAGSETPVVSAAVALIKAAEHLNLVIDLPVTLTADNFKETKTFIFNDAGIAERDIAVTLFWTVPAGKSTPVLSWNVNIDEARSEDWWNVRIDAITGEFIEKDNWTVSEAGFGTPEQFSSSFHSPKQSFLDRQRNSGPDALSAAPPTVTDATYRVIPYPLESPLNGGPANQVKPWLLAGAGNNSTTNGWHFDGTTNYDITRGNNVFAYLDVQNINAPNAVNNWPDTSTTANPNLTFINNPDFNQQPSISANNVNKKFALDNLFYWNNIIHDIAYQYGLTEASGSFQTDNLGRGGAGNDAVAAHALDGAGYNNANFSTPADGGSGRMQMYLWIGTPNAAINSPAAIAGPVQASEAGLVTTVPSKLLNTGPITNTVVFYNDATGGTHSGCTPASNAAAILGHIALIDATGGAAPCTTFAYKVKNAQNAGAIACIIYFGNNTSPSVGGSDAVAATITIPVISITNATGVAIINQLTLGNPVSFTMSSGIYRDGDADNGIIVHEYGHGVSNRLTGGPANASCLGHAEQGGEGWSDYLGLMMTTNWATAAVTDGALSRGIGNYATSQPATGAGIRRYPYSTNMAVNPLTYANMATNTQVHAIGEIWCSTLWDMTWNIIQQKGTITPDFYNSAALGGNVVAMNLVMTGMKLQPCQPGYIDARNAILAADSILYNSQHRCAIWNAFARRGMGFSASQGLSTSALDQIVATDLPTGMNLSRLNSSAQMSSTQKTFSHTATCNCSPVTGYVVRDTIPAGFTYVSSNPVGTLAGNVLTFPAANFTAGETKAFSVTLSAAGSGCVIDSVINDNRESATAGGLSSSGTAPWTTSTVRSASPSSSWFIANSTTATAGYLTSSAIAAGAGKNLSIFSFNHYFNTELRYDGGAVEYSTNGTVWNDAGPLMFPNSYNQTMLAGTGLSGRRAFSGTNVNFRQALFNVSSFGITPVQLRFRFESDGGGAAQGWFVDDIVRVNGCGGMLKTGVYNNAGVMVDTSLTPMFITPLTVVPLRLLNFTAEIRTTKVVLDWNTANEDLENYDVEWRGGTGQWTKLGVVTALNNAANDYNFVHSDPVKGNNFYRLKMNDKNGSFSYSPVRLVIINDKANPQPVLIPNPAGDVTTLYISSNAAPTTVKIFDAAGARVAQYTVKAGLQQLTISTAKLATGLYMVEVSSSTRAVVKLLVQR